MAPKQAKIGPTTRPDGVQRRQNRAKLVQRRGQNHENVGEKKQRNKEEASTPQHRPTLGENGANLAPTWLPKWSQDGQKNRSQTRSFF